MRTDYYIGEGDTVFVYQDFVNVILHEIDYYGTGKQYILEENVGLENYAETESLECGQDNRIPVDEICVNAVNHRLLELKGKIPYEIYERLKAIQLSIESN